MIVMRPVFSRSNYLPAINPLDDQDGILMVQNGVDLIVECSLWIKKQSLKN